MTDCFRINLTGSETSFDCSGGDTILRAGLREGLGLAYECNVGACGSCKFDLIEGEVVDLFPEATGLRPKEKARGKRLACQSIPRQDCKIKIHTGSEYVSAIKPKKLKARFVEKRFLTPDIALFTFVAEKPAEFLPGQYAMISLSAVSQSRAYSMSNISNTDGIWQFIIRRVQDGLFTSSLFNQLKLNDKVDIDGPFGVAYLRAEVNRPIVGIAGGSGLAPILSIIRGAALSKLPAPTPTLLYGGRAPTDIPDVRGVLSTEGIEIDFHPVISMPELAESQHWTGEVGFVHEFIAQKLCLPLPSYEFYLAGPPLMIEAAVRLLVAEQGVPATQIHFDRFF